MVLCLCVSLRAVYLHAHILMMVYGYMFLIFRLALLDLLHFARNRTYLSNHPLPAIQTPLYPSAWVAITKGTSDVALCARYLPSNCFQLFSTWLMWCLHTVSNAVVVATLVFCDIIVMFWCRHLMHCLHHWIDIIHFSLHLFTSEFYSQNKCMLIYVQTLSMSAWNSHNRDRLLALLGIQQHQPE